MKAVATPGVKGTFAEYESDEELPSKLHTAFRGSAARGNYLAADRIDAMYACKEICRWMSKPTVFAWTALKRVCRYLHGVPRLVYTYPQQSVEGVDVYTDTDWAGCPKTRKSTSGGCVMLGSHCIKHWSSTQSSVALSSGEAEFAGVIRGAGQGLGYKALLQDLGVGAQLRVWTDSSAAVGICNRQGLGKLRHLDTHTLWIQQAVRTGRVDLRKVLGERNPADLLTKHSLSRERLEMLVALHGCKYLAGRAGSAPKMREGETTRTTMASEGGGLIGAAGDGNGAAHKSARVVVVDGSVDGGTLQGSGAPDEDARRHLDSGSPTMPHLYLRGKNLDDAYPPIAVPDDEALPDLVRDEHDCVLQQGMKEAEQIARQARDQGRKRNMSPTAMPMKSGQAKETVKDGVNLMEETEDEMATSRSSLGRRRSESEGLPPGEVSKGYRCARSRAGSREDGDRGDVASSDLSKSLSDSPSSTSLSDSPSSLFLCLTRARAFCAASARGLFPGDASSGLHPHFLK